MNLLSIGNTKLARDKIFSFSIPAYESGSGFRTCPGAKQCITGCYARQGFHGMSWVKNAKEKRLAATKQSDFVTEMVKEIKRRNVKILRIHDAGDFYNFNYLVNWATIAANCPETHFYTYTKMIPFFKNSYSVIRLKNWTVIYSFGGKWDGDIDVEKDHHAKVFRSHEDMLAAGYADATESDLVAIANRKVGLVYHGGKNLIWGEKNEAEKISPLVEIL